jgi:hypothetical protein
MDGWIKIHRKIQNHWIWTDNEPFSKRDAWIDLLLSANHAENKALLEGKLITVKRGEFITSEVKLAAKWRWHRKKVRSFLMLLESDEMIAKKCTTKYTSVTIVNYDSFQYSGTTEDTTEGTSDGQVGNTNNNDQEEKELYRVSEVYPKEFEEFWSHYLNKKEKQKAYRCWKTRVKEGYEAGVLLLAAKNYEAECLKEGKELRYIKRGSTFLGPDRPFKDYLKQEKPKDPFAHYRGA